MARGGCGRAPDSYHTGTRCSRAIARRAAVRSAANSPSVEEMNTRTRWSGVKMTPGCSWPGTWLTDGPTPVPGKVCFAGSLPRSITTLERCDGFRPRVNPSAGSAASALYGLDMSHQVHGCPAQRRCHGRHHVCSLRRTEAFGEAGQLV